jgi:hypothetical protein
MSATHSIEAHMAGLQDADANREIRGSAARALKLTGEPAAVTTWRREQNQK